MRSIRFVIVMLIAGALPAAAADWAPLPAMPTARFGAGAAAVNGNFYVLGGAEVVNLADVSVWNETSGSWSQAPAMGTARQFPGAAAVGGQVYAMGGYGPFGAPVATAERFDPSANAWSPIAAMPGVRALAGVAVLNGSIYVMSGEGDAGVPQASCYRFDPAGGWTQVQAVSMARSGATAAVMNGEVYLMGGANGAALTSTEIFNPASGWRAGPPMPEALWMPASASFEGRIWVMGGFDVGFNRSDRVYSLGTDGVWRQETSMPLALAGAAAASDGMRLVVAGGMNNSGQPVAAAVERMSTLPPPPPPPPPASEDTLFCSVEVSPQTLNLKSFGRWISATIGCEDGSVEAIDVASLTLGGVPVDMDAPVSIEGNELSVKFPREGFRFLADGEVTLALEGWTHDALPVFGEGWIRVSGGDSKKPQGSPIPAMKPGRGENGRFTAGSVEFTLEAPTTVSMDVIDIQGRRLAEIASGTYAAGTHTVEWGGVRQASTGVYFVRARFGNDTQFMRFAVIR